MRLSIIIPTHNRVDYLKQAIDSALEQDYDNFEIVVSDNASTDGTLGLLRQYARNPLVRYFRNSTNIGMVPNWRRAVFELACADWFVLLSDDDYFIDRKYLRNVSDLVSSRPDLALVYADGYLFNESTSEKRLLDLPFSGVVSGETVFRSRGQVTPQDFTLCNVFFRRDLARQLNAFSNADNLSCDTELFLLSCLHGDVGIIKGAVSVYRIHSRNLLKSVSENPRLCYGALDGLVSPYLAARKMGFQHSAETLRRSACMDREVLRSMLKIACLDRRSFREMKAELTARAPELAEILQTPTNRILESLCLTFPFLYRAYKTSRQLKERYTTPVKRGL